MGKLIRITLIVMAFVLLFATVKPNTTSASTYVNKEFAALAKKGKLKGVYGNVNLTYKTLKKKQKGKVSQSEAYLFYSTKNAAYGFFYGSSYTKITSGQKVVLIDKWVSTKVTASQMRKYFGKPVAWHTYKAGKYYIRYINRGKGKVEFHLGTKSGLNAYNTSDEDGTLTIK
ncbi:hypothetical protein [Bacillus sp. X1(2014)]|uniref:hypothetical protein n=1 Tax=Bacillus sp. X1(2014) TaxID=1565991 RepID=UPI00119FE230|nr:hypothetical protein [Bacillus sp. X1(2014)]